MVHSSESSLSALAFRMKCLERDHETALGILLDILRSANLGDAERLQAVVNDLVSDYESNVSSAGQMYASQRASARFSPILRQNEMWNGIAQWLHLKTHDLAEGGTLAALGKALEALRDKIVKRQRLLVHLCAGPSAIDQAHRMVERFIGSLEDAHGGAWHMGKDGNRSDLPSGDPLEIFRIPSSVSFSAMVCKAAEPFEPLQAHQSVLAYILTTNHLWAQVRGLGGAYGVSAHIDMLERLCTFSSYRDPRIAGTLRDFRAVLEQVVRSGVSQELIDQAIISLVGRELRPLYPKDAAMIAFRRALYGITDTFRADRRSWILSTTADDIKSAAKSLLDSLDREAGTVVITGQELLERECEANERLRVESVKLPL